MKQQYFKLMICFMGIAFIANSCGKKFLDKKPLGSLNETNVTNKAGMQAILIGAYSLLDGSTGLTLGNTDVTGITYGAAGSNWVYGSVCADDSYKGSTP